MKSRSKYCRFETSLRCPCALGKHIESLTHTHRQAVLLIKRRLKTWKDKGANTEKKFAMRAVVYKNRQVSNACVFVKVDSQKGE
jgi:hypothetical protein